MKFFKKIQAHYEVTALGTEVAMRLIKHLETLPGVKEQQAYLEKFVADEGIIGDDLKDLMYDLQKNKWGGLQKPKVTTKEGSTTNPLIERLNAGKIDQDLGAMLNQMADDPSNPQERNYYSEFVAYLEKNPGKYGKFISEAEKNAINFYENSFDKRIKITKAALEQASDEYLKSSILYSAVYGGKDITPDAVEYAFSRFPNPFVTDAPCEPCMMFELAIGQLPEEKMKKWYAGLPQRDKDSLDDFYDEMDNDESTKAFKRIKG